MDVAFCSRCGTTYLSSQGLKMFLCFALGLHSSLFAFPRGSTMLRRRFPHRRSGSVASAESSGAAQWHSHFQIARPETREPLSSVIPIRSQPPSPQHSEGRPVPKVNQLSAKSSAKGHWVRHLGLRFLPFCGALLAGTVARLFTALGLEDSLGWRLFHWSWLIPHFHVDSPEDKTKT